VGEGEEVSGQEGGGKAGRCGRGAENKEWGEAGRIGGKMFCFFFPRAKLGTLLAGNKNIG
jgi:hypothetical protein